jgi:hypothetical protein
MSRATLAHLTMTGVIALVLSVVISQAARAGSYTVSACSPFTTPGPWSEVDTFPTGVSVGNMCGGPMVGPLGGGNQGALYAEDNAQNTATNIPNNAQAGWSFAAPAGTVVTGVSYYRDLEIAPTSDDFVVGLFEADGTRLEACQGTFQNHYTCSAPNNQAPVSFSGLSTGGLFFGVQCQLQPAEEHCLSGSPGHQLATADMYSVAVTLTEQSSPVISGESGSLWGGGVVSGVVSLSFQTTDPSGIERLAVSDGTALGGAAQESCDFTQTVPCPQLQPGVLSVDTTRFLDGRGEVALVATDAAGNTTVATSPALIIDNNGPSAPTSFTASAAASLVVNLAWSDPPNPPEPVTGAFAQLCQATCAPAVPVSPAGGGQIKAPGPGSYTVRLWLVDGAAKGGPQNAATTAVVVPSPPSTGGKGGEGQTPRPLRLSVRLHNSRLAVAVSVPSGEHGPVTVHLDVPHGRRLTFVARHEVEPRHGVTRTVFVLSKHTRRAHTLLVAATAAGAASARLTVNLHQHR